MGLETAADCSPSKGFENAINQRVEQQDYDGAKQKRHRKQRNA
jgi:hypothetical protein